MSYQAIGLGTNPNDGTGATLRAAGTIINANFTELYNTLGATAGVLPFQLPTNVGSAGQVLQTNGAGQTSWVPGGASYANPTASVGLAAVNGSATTAMRSDAAPALSQAIIPTWTGAHTFNAGLTIGSAQQLLWSADLILTRSAAASLQLGAADAAAPVAQTLQAQSVVAGTSNTAGVDWTFVASKGTGTGVGGRFVWQLAPAGTTGTSQNAAITVMTLDSLSNLLLHASATIGTISGDLSVAPVGSLNLGAASSLYWQIFSGTGHFRAVTDNQNDIGASGANRPRNLFLAGGVTHGSATLLTTTTALTNNAAAQTATLTNGPTAGNPTKWIPINDNGTTRNIPAW